MSEIIAYKSEQFAPIPALQELQAKLGDEECQQYDLERKTELQQLAGNMNEAIRLIRWIMVAYPFLFLLFTALWLTAADNTVYIVGIGLTVLCALGSYLELRWLTGKRDRALTESETYIAADYAHYLPTTKYVVATSSTGNDVTVVGLLAYHLDNDVYQPYVIEERAFTTLQAAEAQVYTGELKAQQLSLQQDIPTIHFRQSPAHTSIQAAVNEALVA